LWTLFQLFLTIPFLLQQISNLLIVDFYKTSPDDILTSLGSLDGSNNMIKTSRNNPFEHHIFVVSNHRKGLTRSCLTVGEYSSIEALESVLDDVVGAGLVDLELFGLDAEDVVEDELF